MTSAANALLYPLAFAGAWVIGYVLGVLLGLGLGYVSDRVRR